jgi:hypothetical protein
MAVGGHHGEVHENARQVEQAGEPAGDEDDVEGFYPEHDVSACHFRGGGDAGRHRRVAQAQAQFPLHAGVVEAARFAHERPLHRRHAAAHFLARQARRARQREGVGQRSNHSPIASVESSLML